MSTHTEEIALAQQNIDAARDRDFGTSTTRLEILAAAQVHATLALAAATVPAASLPVLVDDAIVGEQPRGDFPSVTAWAKARRPVAAVVEPYSVRNAGGVLDPSNRKAYKPLPMDLTTARPPDASADLVALSQWIDDHNAGRDPEAITWGRLSKASEEVGELVGAYIGYTGQNPRKGITHSRTTVVDEALDVAVTVLGLIEHLTGHEGTALALLNNKIISVARRARLVL
jgi:hypothetical protein